MYSRFQLARKYIRYYFTASNGKGHGIHSPFVYDFIRHVLNDKRNFYAYQKVESHRFLMMYNSTQLEVEDFGAGSVSGAKKKRSIASIVKNAAKPPKLGQLLFRIANYYQPKTIIELGTSLGLSTAYLAMGNAAAHVITCEGATAIAAVAKENFSLMGLNNIAITEGDFDKTLQPLLQTTGGWDLAFIDGNHRKEPTLRYFEQLLRKKNESSILIFDDIHWSKEMETAWTAIKEHSDTTLTIDLFFIGLVFFRKEFKVKQHFAVRF